jgi:hypothetical protein
MSARRPAFTLIEITLGIAMTAVIGAALAGLSAALAELHQDSQAKFAALRIAGCTMRRTQAALRQARLILGASGDDLLLWVRDDNRNE